MLRSKILHNICEGRYKIGGQEFISKASCDFLLKLPNKKMIRRCTNEKAYIAYCKNYARRFKGC